jgi:two-component system response regulator BaeR
MEEKVLIIEDEPKVADLLDKYLRQAGFRTTWLGNGAEALALIRADRPDVVLLDLMLPGRDGLEICKDVRLFSNVPVIMVTARIEEIDRLLGLELGADDYICKPFSPREVVARVKAVLRRTRGGKAIEAPGLVLDEARYMAVLDGRDLALTAVEFKLLQVLAASPGRIYGRQQLMDRIYPDQRVVADRSIDSHIKRLRKKISAVSPGEELIHSVYSLGYKFEVLPAPVSA